jgi:hypothetical protein
MVMYEVRAKWLYPNGTEGADKSIAIGPTPGDALRHAAKWADENFANESSTPDEGETPDLLDLTLCLVL